MALTQISTQGIKDGTITGTDLATNVDLVDNQKLRLGTGNDLQIYHDGTNSLISDTGNGYLKIDSNGSGIYLTKSDGESMASFITDGAVELFHNGTKKFETTSYGAAITSSGSSHGLKVFHSNGNEVASLTHGGSGDEGALILKDSNTATVAIRGEVGLDIDITTGGNFDLEHDSAKLRFGAGNDLEIYHDGSESLISNANSGVNLVLKSAASAVIKHDTETMAQFIGDGAVELYHDNSKKFETTSTGVSITGQLDLSSHLDMGDSDVVKLGDGDDLQLYHDSSNSYIANYGGNLFINGYGTEKSIACIPNGAVELYHDNSKKFETSSTGITITGDANWYDNGKAEFGNAADLQIYHNGTGSLIDNDTGNLLINTASGEVQINKSTSEYMARFIVDGAVELYHNNEKRITTRSGGNAQDGAVIYGNSSNVAVNFFTDTTVRGSVYANSSNQIGFLDETENWSVNFDRGNNCYLTGHWVPNANNTYDLGTSSYRWRNIYTNDLNLSNEGGANDVDGTWGSYTIQEGAEDLFLVNKRNGKKYKFNLTEVS